MREFFFPEKMPSSFPYVGFGGLLSSGLDNRVQSVELVLTEIRNRHFK